MKPGVDGEVFIANEAGENGGTRQYNIYNKPDIVHIYWLPYLEKQNDGQWMATLQQAKVMGISTIVNTKSARPKGWSPKKKVITRFAAGLVSFIGPKMQKFLQSHRC